MALHPFHSFRKHQKAIFAGLTIVCMLSFVMSSGIAGVGDGFSWLQQVLTGRSRNPRVGELFKRDVEVREINTLREQRTLANRYMSQAVFRAHQNIIRDAMPVIDQLDENSKNAVLQFLRMRQSIFDPAQSDQDRYIQQIYRSQYEQNLDQFRYQLMLIRDNLEKANKKAEADKIALLGAALQGTSYLLKIPKDELYPNSDLYFGGSLTNEGLMDFMIWQKEADRLGIYLSTDDILRLVQIEALGRLTNEDGLAIERSIIPRNQRTPVDFVKALGEEFRVRLAQTALLGFDPGGIMRVPAPITPNELWDYYRKNRTEIDVKLLPIPVSKFIDQVKEKPTDEQLTKLFDEYKNFEPNPQSPTPGFKQPRRFKVEWVGVNPEAPFYKKEARKVILSALAGTPGDPWTAIALLDPVLNEYGTATGTLGNDGSLRIADWNQNQFGLSYETYAHWQRADSAAALVGKIAGVSVTGNPLAVFFSSQAVANLRESKNQQAAVAAEVARRAPLYASLVTAGLAPSPVLVMSGLWQVLEKKEFYLPMEAVKNRLVSKLEETLAREAALRGIEAFRKDMEAAKGKPAEAAKVIEKYVKEGAWQHEVSTTFDDLFSASQNPKLAKLKEAYLADHLEDPKARIFGSQFVPMNTRGQAKLYVPEPLRVRSSESALLFWRTADEPAKVLTFEEAKPAVEKAWRFEKARELAKQEAEKIAKQSPGDPVAALQEAAKKFGETPFDLYNVCYLRPALQSRGTFGGGTEFENYRPPEDKIEYPPMDLITKLIDPGTVKSTVVLSNQPQNIEYVAAVTNRVEPDVAQFQKNTSPLFRQNQLLQQLEHDKRLAYRFDVMNHLREKAGMRMYDLAAQTGQPVDTRAPVDEDY